MQSVISIWAVSVTAAILLSAIVSSMLPEGGIKKYVCVVLGIVATIIILAPIARLLSGADVLSELESALGNIHEGKTIRPDGSAYKDYIYRLYEVYIEDDSNKYINSERE